MGNKIQKLYDLTRKFNDISCASKELSEEAFLQQYYYIKEEFNELAATVGDGDCNVHGKLSLEDHMLTSALDDCIDILITTFGMLQKLENLGVDINSAAIDTAMNNLSKYTSRPYVVHETVERLAREDISAKATFNEEENCYIIRDAVTGKVKKPFDFVSNDLSKYITTEVKGNYAKHNG